MELTLARDAMSTALRRPDADTSGLLAHAESCTRRGRLDAPTLSGSLRNALCGDVVRLDLLLDDGGRIVQVRFDGRGCVISQAGASILCAAIEGRPVEEVRAIRPARVLELVQVPLSPTRQVCALLAHCCLHSLLNSDEAAQVREP